MIQLYSLVINDRDGIQVPIYSMISERHDANIIMFWLSEWRKQGGIVPKEYTCDMSLALLNAAARALADFPSLDQYIERLFQIASNSNSNLQVPTIRIDFAHLMKNICDSAAFHDTRPKVKQFFVRCFAELIKETNFERAENHIQNILVIALSTTEGSTEDGYPIPCEIAKKEMERKIMGIESYQEYSEHGEEDQSYSNQNELLEFVENNENLASLNAWLKGMKERAEITVTGTDNGDRDNLMYNVKFAKHFLRLCNLLPLWSGISCEMFASPSVTSSSAGVESYFNDLKRTMKSTIPCRADVFLSNHMDGINDAVITASRKYAKPVETIATINSATKASDKKSHKQITQEDEDVIADALAFDVNAFMHEIDHQHASNNKSTPKKQKQPPAPSSPEENPTVDTCVACKNGHYPPGAHTCHICKKNVHALDGCSMPINSEEGYGTQRICMACHKMKPSQVAKEMQYTSDWSKNKKQKSSTYMVPNPMFNLTSNMKKEKIGLLMNGNTFKKPFVVDGETIQLRNTCAPDALIQAIAGAYAHYPAMRKYYDELPDELVNIAIALAKK